MLYHDHRWRDDYRVSISENFETGFEHFVVVKLLKSITLLLCACGFEPHFEVDLGFKVYGLWVTTMISSAHKLIIGFTINHS